MSLIRSFFALWLCVGSGFAFSQTPFKFQQRRGPFPVGLLIVYQYDHTRPDFTPDKKLSPSLPDKSGRPLQTLIWFPSESTTEKPMTVGDYAHIADTETQFTSPNREQNKWPSQLKSSYDISLWAVRDAKPRSGRYPVLIYAPSDSSVAWENADLCEFLASQGYVVLASPSMGASTRNMTDDLGGIDAQARDLSFLITYAASLPNADAKVGILSWSWGGLSSLFAAARDPRISVLVQMDGSMRYYPGLVKKATYVHPERMTLPLLFFTSDDPNFIEGFDRSYKGAPADVQGPSVLNAWKHGDLITVNMMGMSHPEFCSMFQRRKTTQRFAEDQVADYGREDANTSYAWVSFYTLKFLDAYMKGEAAAKAFLLNSPAENGVPQHFMGISFRSRQAVSSGSR
jgi:dienelactone hydrolase